MCMHNSSLEHKGSSSNSPYNWDTDENFMPTSHLLSQGAPFPPIAITAKDHLAHKLNVLQSQHWVFTWQFLGLYRNEL